MKKRLSSTATSRQDSNTLTFRTSTLKRLSVRRKRSIKNTALAMERRHGHGRSPLCLRVMFFDVLWYEPSPMHVNQVWKSLDDTFLMVKTAVEVVTLEFDFMTLTKKVKQQWLATKAWIPTHKPGDKPPQTNIWGLSGTYVSVIWLYPSAWIDPPLTFHLALHWSGTFTPQKTEQVSFFSKPHRSTDIFRVGERERVRVSAWVSEREREPLLWSGVPLSASTSLVSGKRILGV